MTQLFFGAPAAVGARACAHSVRVAAMEVLPISVAEAKAWAGVTLAGDDALFDGLIRTAAEHCEAHIGQMLMVRDVVEDVPVRLGAWLALSREPVRAVACVEAVAKDGAVSALGVEAYEIDIDAGARGLVRVMALGDIDGGAGKLRVTYQAGLAADGEELPEAVRQGMLRMVAYLYAARDDGRDVVAPAAVQALWWPYKRMRV